MTLGNTIVFFIIFKSVLGLILALSKLALNHLIHRVNGPQIVLKLFLQWFLCFLSVRPFVRFSLIPIYRLLIFHVPVGASVYFPCGLPQTAGLCFLNRHFLFDILACLYVKIVHFSLLLFVMFRRLWLMRVLRRVFEFLFSSSFYF